jgi:hypothetical protein
MHSDVNSEQHREDAKRRVWARAGTLVEVRSIPHEMPRFVQKGELKTPGNLAWIVRDDKLENVEGGAMVEELNSFRSEILRQGVFRKGVVRKGKQYYQKADDVQPLKRQTIAVPPWFSKVWEEASEEWRVKSKGLLISKIHKLAKERWPHVQILALSLHDDTSNLHIDVWASEVRQQVTKLRKADVVKNVFEQSFFAGVVGPGTVYIQAKEDVGHVLHSEDRAKLERSLEQYRVHRESSKSKELPEVPEGIDFQRKLDRMLSGIFAKPEVAQRFKSKYVAFCRELDKVKYAVHTKFAEVAKLQQELKDKELALESKWEDLGDMELAVVKMADEVEKKEAQAMALMAEAQERLDNFLMHNEFALAIRKLCPSDASILKFLIKEPKLGQTLAMRAKISKVPYWQNFYEVFARMASKKSSNIEIEIM